MVIQNIVTEALLTFKILTWKNSPLTIVFNLKYQMKFFEKLFEIFLVFAQFIQIDAIVGGYESERHGNALINRLI